MQSSSPLNESALLSRIPTLAPGPWQGAEALGPEDHALLERVTGETRLADIVSSSGLDGASVARSALRLHALGIIEMGGGTPFFDEGLLFSSIPRFDPHKANRQAAIDEPDRLLLAVVDGRTDLDTICRFVGLPRERIVSSALRMSQEGVIDLVPPERTQRQAEKPRPSAHPAPPPASERGSGVVERLQEEARRELERLEQEYKAEKAAEKRPGTAVRPARIPEPNAPEAGSSSRHTPSTPAMARPEAKPALHPPAAPAPSAPPPARPGTVRMARPPAKPETDKVVLEPHAGKVPAPQATRPGPSRPFPQTVEGGQRLETKAADLLAQLSRLSDEAIEKQARDAEAARANQSGSRHLAAKQRRRTEEMAALGGRERSAAASQKDLKGKPTLAGGHERKKTKSFSLEVKFDAREVVKFAFLAAVLAGGYFLVSVIWKSSGEPATKPVPIAELRRFLPIIETYPSGERFQARVSDEWNSLDKETRKERLLKMLFPVIRAGYTSVYLYDRGGSLVATWANGTPTIRDEKGALEGPGP